MMRRDAPLNLGWLDRAYRLGVGLSVGGLALLHWKLAPIALVMGALPLWTALTGRCPAYRRVGMSSLGDVLEIRWPPTASK
jgi:hypothetical protein